jgi:hypothetical protein
MDKSIIRRCASKDSKIVIELRSINSVAIMMMNFKNTREGISTHSEVLRTKMDGYLGFGLVQQSASSKRTL